MEDRRSGVRPAWCPTLTAEDNGQVGPLLGEVLTGHRASAGLPGLSWGGPYFCWHEDPTHDGVLVEVLLRLGLAYSSLGKFAHAAQLLRRALLRVDEMAVGHRYSSRGRDPSQDASLPSSTLSPEGMRAELLGTLSNVLCQQGLTQDAEAMLWQARQLAKHANHPELYVRITCDLAEFNHKYKGNLREAQKHFQRGLEARIQTLGYDHLDTAHTLNAVGVFAAQRGNFEEARRLIHKAWQIRHKLLGGAHVAVAEALHNLAAVQESLQDLAEAERCYQQALKIKRQVLPPNHVSIADTQNNLSVLYAKTRKHEECVALLRQCLAQCMHTVGELHTSTASVLMNLGHALHSLASAHRAESSRSAYMAQLQEAEQLLCRALASKRTLFANPNHPGLAQCHANLGYVYHKKEDYHEAEKHFASAAALCQKHYGPNHPDSARWLYWLGKTRCRLGDLETGRTDLRMALRLAEEQTSQAQQPQRARADGSLGPFTSEQLQDLKALLEGCAEISPAEDGFSSAEAEAAPGSSAAAPGGRPRTPSTPTRRGQRQASRTPTAGGRSNRHRRRFLSSSEPVGPTSHLLDESDTPEERGSSSSGHSSLSSKGRDWDPHLALREYTRGTGASPTSKPRLGELMERVRKSTEEYAQAQRRAQESS